MSFADIMETVFGVWLAALGFVALVVGGAMLVVWKDRE